jgi:hypothetical protein
MTHVDNPAINNLPNALLQVTQLTPSDVDPHPFGIWYDASLNEWTIFNEDLQSIPLGTTFVISYAWPSDFGTTATTSNSVANYTYIDNVATNGNPDVKVFVTQRWTGTYNAHEIGVWYTGTKWAIFNEDASPIMSGATFNVHVSPSTDSSSILQVATPQNTYAGVITYIDAPGFNGNPNRSLWVTQYWNGTYNNHPIGIWYDSSQQRWTIFNVDYQPMPVDTLFFVWID